MTTVDVLIVAKESILIEKFKKNMQSHFFRPMLYHSGFQVSAKKKVCNWYFFDANSRSALISIGTLQRDTLNLVIFTPPAW